LGLVRNLGEVYGVFGQFSPQKDPHNLLQVDYLTGDSANFDGLTRLEKLVRKIGPPKWPFAINEASRQRGADIFARHTDQGGCVDCHGERPGQFRGIGVQTWATPLMDVQTDSREYDVLKREATTGVLAGTGLPFNRLGPSDKQFTILATSVAGSIAQKYTPFGETPATGFVVQDLVAGKQLSLALPPSQQDLLTAYRLRAPVLSILAPQFKYESRVLHGIWATAPYLHNGSVATLADLLNPSAARAPIFAVGRAYDTKLVGLAKVQPRSTAVRVTTGCDDRNSGNSRCGHEYGLNLNPAEKQDLLEYLKTL